jgi:hypothetical protein
MATSLRPTARAAMPGGRCHSRSRSLKERDRGHCRRECGAYPHAGRAAIGVSRRNDLLLSLPNCVGPRRNKKPGNLAGRLDQITPADAPCALEKNRVWMTP